MMENKGSLQIETKRSERLVGWLLILPLVIFFWAFTVGLTFLFLSAFPESMRRGSAFENLFVFAAVGIVIGMLVFLSKVFLGKLHDVLATYEFNEQIVVKESPFYRQEAKWCQVSGWALSNGDQTWWLLDSKGRPLLSLDWHLLPSEKSEEAKLFTFNQLLRFLPSAKWVQPSLWKYWSLTSYIIGYMLNFLVIVSFLQRYANQKTNPAAFVLTLTLIGVVLFVAIYSFKVPSRSDFVVHGDWLKVLGGIFIHLPTIKHAIMKPNGMLIITNDNQTFVVPKKFKWLLEYLSKFETGL